MGQVRTRSPIGGSTNSNVMPPKTSSDVVECDLWEKDFKSILLQWWQENILLLVMQLHRSDMPKWLGWTIPKLEGINVIDDITWIMIRSYEFNNPAIGIWTSLQLSGNPWLLGSRSLFSGAVMASVDQKAFCGGRNRASRPQIAGWSLSPRSGLMALSFT